MPEGTGQHPCVLPAQRRPTETQPTPHSDDREDSERKRCSKQYIQGWCQPPFPYCPCSPSSSALSAPRRGEPVGEEEVDLESATQPLKAGGSDTRIARTWSTMFPSWVTRASTTAKCPAPTAIRKGEQPNVCQCCQATSGDSTKLMPRTHDWPTLEGKRTLANQ